MGPNGEHVLVVGRCAQRSSVAVGLSAVMNSDRAVAAARNPFLPTFGTSPPVLAGRDDVVARFGRAFERGPTHPDFTMLITGVRGSGKTVLLNEAEDAALRLGWRVISMSASVRRLCRLTTNAALQHLEHAGDATPPLRISSVSLLGAGVEWAPQPPDPRGEFDLRSAITSLAALAADSDTGLLVTVDELQAVALEEATELAVTVQHVTRRELLPVAFVGAALPEIDEALLADRGMTFFQRCARARLTPLRPDHTADALSEPIRRAGGRIDDEALEHLVGTSCGHPFTIQLLGYHSWEMAAPAFHINATHAAAGALEADYALLEQIVKPIWTGLSDMDRAFLSAMALDEADSEINLVAWRLGRSANYAQTYRRRLIDAGVIEPAGRGKVRFSYQQMRPWLRSQQ